MKMPIPIQPRDPNDELYKIIKEYLEYGDQKLIALNLEVAKANVSRVTNGAARSQRIWKAIMEVVLKKKEDNDHTMKYLMKAS